MLHPSRLLTAALVALLTTTPTLLPAAQGEPRLRERFVNKATLPDEPVWIAGLKNKRKQFRPWDKFVDGEDWLDGFTVTVLNISGKAITSLHVAIRFPRPEGHEGSERPPLSYSLRWGPDPFTPEYQSRDKSKVVKPKEKLDLVLEGEHYEAVRHLLKELKYQSVERIELMVLGAGFEDGTVWFGGSKFRPDPEHPGKFLREKRQPGGARVPRQFFDFRLP